MARAFRFICLDPRKEKRRTIARSLEGLGPVVFRRFGPLSLRDWPETDARAHEALEAARGKPETGGMRWLKRGLYALQYNGARRLFAADPQAIAVCWNGLNGSRRAFMQGAADAGARRLYYELAPLPGRFTVDPCGVNAVNGLPRRIAPYLAWQAASGPAPEAWRAAGRAIRQRPPLVPPEATAEALPPLSDPFIFVPLQTPGDSQIRLFGGNFKTVEAFVDTLGEVAQHLPAGWHLRVKEHPTAPTSFAERIRALHQRRVVLDNVSDTFMQVAQARAVLTVNSSVGLEAMFLDKPVLAAGECFWAVEGVARHTPDEAALARALRGAADLDFDPEARSAFLNFLTHVYYPPQEQVAELIAARLEGVDSFGFWAGV